MSLLSTFQVEKQKVDDAINVVCDRLEHATLLQDRRAAVLALKGFARDYKETVTAGGLRGLLRSLSIDRDDEEILNATLECLLTLFTVDAGGRADDTALWIADEFTLRPENTHNLLSIIGDINFYTRLRSIQILASILECRAEQLQECVMNSPTGTSALVSILDDKREQIRNEGLLLLLKLVRHHVEIQKRVAFENAFEKILAIVEEEGGLEGGIVTSDCFTFLHNLIADNLSNQNWFRETEFFKKVTDLLQAIDKEETSLISVSVVQNTNDLLKIVRLFVLRSSHNRVTNQNAFMKAGLVTQVIGIAFAPSAPAEIRAAALLTLADLMYNNKDLQDYFVKACFMVLDPMHSAAHDANDISALLDILLNGDDSDFAIRLAAAFCIQSFATGNKDRRLVIVNKLIENYKSEKQSNLLDCLLCSTAPENQHRTWFAACSLLDLTHDDEDARDVVTELSIGNANLGEEEVSLIQSISACLVASLQLGSTRAATAYAMLLSCWLYQSPDNVADFLEESSTLQAILTSLMSSSSPASLKGVLACLLSIAYAFNFSLHTTVNRAMLRDAVLRAGRDYIVGPIMSLLGSEELLVSRLNTPSTPRPLLDLAFVDFFRDNFGLIRKSIDQPPIPVRSRREEEAQEEQDRTEDIIVDLESELERKSSGLEEAVNIIKTRQEEISRLREEIRYIKQKHEVEYANLKHEFEKLREENSAFQADAIVQGDQLDKLQRENALAHNELDVLRERTITSAHDHASLVDEADSLKGALTQEISKRTFLEKELSETREVAARSNQDLESALSSISGLEEDLILCKETNRTDKQSYDLVAADLATVRQASKILETEVNSCRTRARDLDTELKGLRHEQSELEERQATEVSRLKEEVKTSEQSLEVLMQEKTSRKQQADGSSANVNGTVVKESPDSEAAKYRELQQTIQGTNKELQAARDHILLLEARLASSDTLEKKASSDAAARSDTVSSNIPEEDMQHLESRVASLESEKIELQKQLEQAQEDLMLLMDDDEADASEVV